MPETREIAVDARGGTWILEVQDEEDIQRIPLATVPVMVGTSRDADIVVRDPTVSGRHCELVVRDGGVAVRDLGSRNGTYVGGARVQDAWGTEGTMIVIGQTTIACLTPPELEDGPLGPPLQGIAGNSVAMCRVAMQVRRLAKLAAPVLVVGETGVGKELIARALHEEGQRGDASFVALNVAALPRDLVETELFGHERGAFTGAVARRAGAFTEAEGGTLFLDEIGELPVEAQPKLLRALDGYEVRRVGGGGSGHRATARVVAATHAPLIERVRLGNFRRDLYHRLEVFVIELPPLRARPGDILPISRALLERLAPEIGERELTPAAIALLAAYDWPGNVRELRNVLYRAADLTSGNRWISAAAVERALRKANSSILTLTPDLAKEWLMSHGGNVSAAARAAGIPRTTFRKILTRDGIY